jgi:hypothetical protein
VPPSPDSPHSILDERRRADLDFVRPAIVRRIVACELAQFLDRIGASVVQRAKALRDLHLPRHRRPAGARG